ncbi:TPA: hypothetical protein H1011_02715 [archaeon]|jgi:hypothetical protein|uniref:Uncharacterized protein n=1 Tax=Candidatus Undinarchaeum marinum TaxID=2756141 RepID=A0A832V2A7_9ARCH|nr:hypothetical protein [Candidatus Undinarchaeum marinum]
MFKRTKKFGDRPETEIAIEVGLMFIALFITKIVMAELLILLTIVVLLLANFAVRYERNEWKVFVLGTIVGFTMEWAGDALYHQFTWKQTFVDQTLFGMPLWLPALWGYGFVMMRRIGNVLVHEKRYKRDKPKAYHKLFNKQ